MQRRPLGFYTIGKDQYTSAYYKEAQLRREFRNPFFMALGWDIDNKRGFIELSRKQSSLPIDVTDKQIDTLVYELYGLNEEEIKILEDSKKSTVAQL